MLISEEYRKEQELLHKTTNYGIASIGFAPIVSKIINQLKIEELLDYGAGRGNLAKNLNVDHEVTVTMYDPGRPDLAGTPDSAQMVTCLDVLEHIEPEYLDSVLDDLKRCVEFFGFFSIHTGPAVKTLSDGRNAHLIQEGPDWWVPKIMARFDLVQFQAQEHGFFVFVRRK